ncbi:DUF2634 domain-containing protein [Clostridium novyi]
MSIFPDNLNDEDIITNDNEQLEVFKEYAIDFETGQFLYDELGENIIIEKDEAIKVWCWMALQTEKYKYKIYNKFGNEFNTLRGKGFTKELVGAEMFRFAEECLLVNKYIKEILSVETDLTHDILHTKVRIRTVYNGEVEVSV